MLRSFNPYNSSSFTLPRPLYIASHPPKKIEQRFRTMAHDDARIEIISDSIRQIPHFPKAGILFHDVTTLLLNPLAFKHVIDLFVERYKGQHVDVIAGKKISFFFCA
jgi:hypothetical protein